MKIDVENFKINDYLNHDFEGEEGRTFTTKLEHVNIGENVKEDILHFLHEHHYETVFMIEDENTQRAYGRELEEFLKENQILADHVVLEADVVPNEMAVFKILTSMKLKYDYIIGVGSGSLNDLSKFTSKKLNMDYGIAATAPSMDGFASIGAALISNDLKTTYDCHVPTAIFGDVDVLANAPIEMIRAGMGDILGKYNCLVDWKISHVVTGEYYSPTIVNMVYKCVKEVSDNAGGIPSRDRNAVKSITEALVLTGIAMGFVGNSRPASGSEHHVSHYWEMKLLFAHHAPVLHGAKVAIATPGIITLWKDLVKETPDFNEARKNAESFDFEAWKQLVLDHFEGASEGVIELEKKAGKNRPEEVLKRIDSVEEHWSEICDIVNQDLPEPSYIVETLKKVGAPYRPSQVDISEQLVKDSIVLAKEVRVRYGLLQMLHDLSLQEAYSEKFTEYYRHN